MMRKSICGLGLVGLLTGCVPTNFVMPPTGTTEKAAAKAIDASPDGHEPGRSVYRAPITAGQINGVNAKEKAEALRHELDRDMQRTLEMGENP